MKEIVRTSILVCCLSFLAACSSDDGELPEEAPSSAEINFMENPEMGATIDQLSTRVSGGSNFSIALQSHKDALDIDTSTGTLTVKSPLLFDYETNPLITALVDYDTSEGTQQFELKVLLENGDDILHFLSTSKGLYELSNPGNWIMITEAEYETLAENLSEIHYCGSTKEQFNTEFATNPDALHEGAFTIANNNGAEIPEGGYVFAFKYEFRAHASKINIDDSQVKISVEAVDSGYQNLGPALPTHRMDDSFFVLKGNDSPLNSIGYLGMYKDTYIYTNSQFISEEYYYGAGDVSDLDGYVYNQKAFKYQGLATTVKQWD